MLAIFLVIDQGVAPFFIGNNADRGGCAHKRGPVAAYMMDDAHKRLLALSYHPCRGDVLSQDKGIYTSYSDS